jgi:haloacetate dehalogenase
VPVLALRSGGGTSSGDWFDVLAVWRVWAAGDVRGRPLDCGHYLADELPDETAAELRAFLPLRS